MPAVRRVDAGSSGSAFDQANILAVEMATRPAFLYVQSLSGVHSLASNLSSPISIPQKLDPLSSLDQSIATPFLEQTSLKIFRSNFSAFLSVAVSRQESTPQIC